MKRFRLFFKGSKGEKEFLLEKKQKGYILKNINSGLYSFEKVPHLSSASLQIEFCTNDICDSAPMIQTVQKKLLFSNYSVLYSYIEKNKIDHSIVLTETNDVEFAYLKKLNARLFWLNLIETILFLIIWTYLALSDHSIHLTAFFSITMFIIWSINFIWSRKISKRSDSLEENDYGTSNLIVVIEGLPTQPTLKTLNYLGIWSFRTQNKSSYYYRLTTSYSQAQIINELSNFLDINEEDIQIISDTGLFPIGWF